jgi:hypothetical protein
MISNQRVWILSIVLLAIVLSTMVPGNAANVSKNFTVTHFDLTLTFPETANPGDSIMISVNAAARTSVRVVDLSIQVLAYMEGGDLQSIGSVSLANDQNVKKGDTLQKDLTLTIPTNIPRGELIAIVSETTSTTTYPTYYYQNYPGYYQYYYDYYGYDQNYAGPYWYYPYYYSYYYPQSTSQQDVESKTLPCTYVLATTPEYVQLRSDYDRLNSQYQDSQAKYQQATSQINELNNKLAAKDKELNDARILGYAFMAATAIVLAALVAIVLLSRRKTTPPPTASTPNSQSAQ